MNCLLAVLTVLCCISWIWTPTTHNCSHNVRSCLNRFVLFLKWVYFLSQKWSSQLEMHDMGEKKIKPKYIKWTILKKYKHQYFYWKNVINSEYERLSKSSLTGVMKFILIEKAMLTTFVGKIKQEMFYSLWQFRRNTGNQFVIKYKVHGMMVWLPGAIAV